MTQDTKILGEPASSFAGRVYAAWVDFAPWQITTTVTEGYSPQNPYRTCNRSYILRSLRKSHPPNTHLKGNPNS